MEQESDKRATTFGLARIFPTTANVRKASYDVRKRPETRKQENMAQVELGFWNWKLLFCRDVCF